MNKTYKIVDETKDGDIVLESDLTHEQAETLLNYYLYHEHNAFIMEEDEYE